MPKTPDVWIQTYSGRKFNPLNPKPADVAIVDVAHALAFVCRFTGHTSRFYSVAEHSVRVSHVAEYRARSLGSSEKEIREIARWGLIHDGSEAYICDVSSPVKRTWVFAQYRKVEANLQAVIARSCGLAPDVPEIVKVADLVLLAAEAHSLLRGGPVDNWIAPPPTEVPAHLISSLGWDPGYAERAFLDRFAELAR